MKKTRKSITKRFKITKNGKVLRRAVGTNHYLCKNDGKQTRQNKKWIELLKVDAKKIKSLLK
ncbi:MAG: 50S ribosomal protein L35 [Candidatus Nealsonbacteria bacterium]|nr:50S ribosomal protein L35 [Candidatus Nealsonbacteria bacterium]